MIEPDRAAGRADPPLRLAARQGPPLRRAAQPGHARLIGFDQAALATVSGWRGTSEPLLAGCLALRRRLRVLLLADRTTVRLASSTSTQSCYQALRRTRLAHRLARGRRSSTLGDLVAAAARCWRSPAAIALKRRRPGRGARRRRRRRRRQPDHPGCSRPLLGHPRCEGASRLTNSHLARTPSPAATRPPPLRSRSPSPWSSRADWLPAGRG